MARGPNKNGARDEKQRRLDATLDELLASGPPYAHGFDPILVARAALDRLPDQKSLARGQAKKLVSHFDNLVSDLGAIRERLDPIVDPDASFDPANPDTVGRLVVIALLAQERVPLSEIRPTYGSGIYAIYYIGDHPAYTEITRTEMPIYVGKADPKEPMAATPRDQGVRLFVRLSDHRSAIVEVQKFATANGLADPLNIDDFECRRLVCATNAQLVAERHLIDFFKPAWNSETKICFGISKHGDNAQTRRNKKSPWDVLHPGRDWATESEIRGGMTPETITQKLAAHFVSQTRYEDVGVIIEFMLDRFRQIAKAPPEVSQAGAESDEVRESIAQDAEEQAKLDFDSGGAE